jgi:RecG-like helicase
MIIESAGTFWFVTIASSRGRVGRGEQSYCILMTSQKVLIVKPEWKLWFKRMMVLKLPK